LREEGDKNYKVEIIVNGNKKNIHTTIQLQRLKKKKIEGPLPILEWLERGGRSNV